MAAARLSLASMHVLDDAPALARAAADRIVRRLEATGGPLSIVLTGGRTPEQLYKLLASDAYRSRIPWSDVHWFFTDERFVPAEDPRNNASMAMRAMLDVVPVPRANIHRMHTDVASPHESARLYEQELRAFAGERGLDPARPLFTLVLMGVGDDGHTASLFPGQPAVEERSRWALGIDHAGMEPHVPRVTLTLPILGSAHEMLFLVSGREKREIVARIRADADLPSARAHCDGELAWLLDRDAAGQA